MHRIGWVGVNAHRIVCTDGQCLSDDRVTIGLTHRDGGDGSSMLLFQFEGTHEGIPLVVRIDNELNAIDVKLVSPSVKAIRLVVSGALLMQTRNFMVIE